MSFRLAAASPDCQPTGPTRPHFKRKSTCQIATLDKENTTHHTADTSSLQKNVKRLCLATLHDQQQQQQQLIVKSFEKTYTSSARSLDLCLISQNSQDSHDSGFSPSHNFNSPLNDSLTELDALNSCCLQSSALNSSRLLDASLTSESSFSARRCLFKASPMATRESATPKRSLFAADRCDSPLSPGSGEASAKKPLTPVSIRRQSSMKLRASSVFATFAEQSITCIEKMLEDTTQAKCLASHHEQIKKSLEIECQESTSTLTLGTAEVPTHRLIGDRSKYHILPTKTSLKHNDLSVITPHTLTRLLSGHYTSQIASITVIDSRYPYEFQGGHIQSAENLFTKEQVYEKFLANDRLKQLNEEANANGKRSVIIFHCEFSSERGPGMLRFLRNQDRTLNKDSYPKLFYPELYLLEGGYKAFFEQSLDLCVPQAYKPMLHEEHVSDLKHFRAKTKEWGRMGSAVNMTACKSRFRPSLQRFARSTLF